MMLKIASKAYQETIVPLWFLLFSEHGDTSQLNLYPKRNSKRRINKMVWAVLDQK